MPTRPEDRAAGLRLKNGHIVRDRRSKKAKPPVISRPRATPLLKKGPLPGTPKKTQQTYRKVQRQAKRAERAGRQAAHGRTQREANALYRLRMRQTDARRAVERQKKGLEIRAKDVAAVKSYNNALAALGRTKTRTDKLLLRQFANQFQLEMGRSAPVSLKEAKAIIKNPAREIAKSAPNFGSEDIRRNRPIAPIVANLAPQYAKEISKAQQEQIKTKQVLYDPLGAGTHGLLTRDKTVKGTLADLALTAAPVGLGLKVAGKVGGAAFRTSKILSAGAKAYRGGRGVRNAMLVKGLRLDLKATKARKPLTAFGKARQAKRIERLNQAILGAKDAQRQINAGAKVARVPIRTRALRASTGLVGSATRAAPVSGFAAAPLHPVQAATGETGLQKKVGGLHPKSVLGRFAADVLNMSVNAIPMAVVPTVAFVHYKATGDDKALMKLWHEMTALSPTAGFAQGGFHEFLRRLEEHPGFGLAELGGVYAATFRGVGAAGRAVGRGGKEGSVFNTQLQGGRKGIKYGGDVYDRGYSPNVATAVFQKLYDRAVKPENQRKLLVGGKKSDQLQNRAVDLEVATEEAVVRHREHALGKAAKHIDLGDKLAPAVADAIEGVITPKDLVGHIHRELARIKGKQELQGTRDLKVSQARVEALERVLKNPAKLGRRLERARKEYGAIMDALERETSELRGIPMEAFQRAKAKTILVTHGNGRYVVDPEVGLAERVRTTAEPEAEAPVGRDAEAVKQEAEAQVKGARAAKDVHDQAVIESIHMQDALKEVGPNATAGEVAAAIERAAARSREAADRRQAERREQDVGPPMDERRKSDERRTTNRRGVLDLRSLPRDPSRGRRKYDAEQHEFGKAHVQALYDELLAEQGKPTTEQQAHIKALHDELLAQQQAERAHPNPHGLVGHSEHGGINIAGDLAHQQRYEAESELERTVSKLKAPAKEPYRRTAQQVNKVQWGHGAKLHIKDEFDPAMWDPGALMGPGAYHTRDEAALVGYADKRHPVGGHEEPGGTIHWQNLHVTKLLDLEAKAPAWFYKDVNETLGRLLHDNVDQPLAASGRGRNDSAHGLPDELRGDRDFQDYLAQAKRRGASMSDIISRTQAFIRDQFASDGVSRAEAHEPWSNAWSALHERLKDRGYDALSHAGGANVGDRLHQVVIVIDPKAAPNVGHVTSHPVQGATHQAYDITSNERLERQRQVREAAQEDLPAGGLYHGDPGILPESLTGEQRWAEDHGPDDGPLSMTGQEVEGRKQAQARLEAEGVPEPGDVKETPEEEIGNVGEHAPHDDEPTPPLETEELRPLSTEEAVALAREFTGGQEGHYISHQDYLPSNLNARPHVTPTAPVEAVRTGESALEGTRPITYKQILGTPRARIRSNARFVTIARLLETLTDKNHVFKTKRDAERDMPDGYMAVNTDPYLKRAAQEEAIKNGDLDAMDFDSVLALEAPEHEIGGEATTADVPGTWRWIKMEPVKRLQRHHEGKMVSPTLSRATAGWKRVVLTTTPTWYLGNAAQTSVAALLNGLVPPPLGVVAEKTGLGAAGRGVRTLEAFGERGAATFVPGGIAETSMAGARRLRTRAKDDPEVNALTRKIGHITQLPVAKQGTAVWETYRDGALWLNAKLIEEPLFTQVLGKIVGKDVRSALPIWKRISKEHALGLRLADSAIKDFVAGKHGTGSQMALADLINKQTGNWHILSPTERMVKSNFAPFYLWHRAALRFVLMTVPHDHPVFTGLLAAGAEMTHDERQKLGLDIVQQFLKPDAAEYLAGAYPAKFKDGLPDKSGGLRQTSNLTAFGMFADYPGNFANALLPELSGGLAAAGLGTDWKGDKFKYTRGPNKGKTLNLKDRSLLAGYLFVEPFLPFAGLASKWAARGRKTNVPIWSPVHDLQRYTGKKNISGKQALIPSAIPGGRVYHPEKFGQGRPPTSFEPGGSTTSNYEPGSGTVSYEPK